MSSDLYLRNTFELNSGMIILQANFLLVVEDLLVNRD